MLGVALPTQLNATEQDTLVKQIGLSLLRAAPRDWHRVTVEYRAVGRYHELTGEVGLADGTTQEWVATHDIASLFGRLRAGMYREGRGTWFNARYQLDHPSSYNLEYDREEPTWDLAPPPQAYADELRMFPRSEDNVPDWLMRRMAGLGPERPGPRFRMARIFDGPGADGRPTVNRPELDVEEQDRVLDYLDGAPVVVPGRGYDLDRLAANPESTVPIAFHSDGTWIWPAAVNYYLREYGIPPEPELVQHIRSNGFSIPDVPDPVRQAAATHVSRGAPPPQQQQRPTPPPPPEREEAAEQDHAPAAQAQQRREPPQPYDAEPPETDAEQTQLAAPVRAPHPDFDGHDSGESPDFQESDAERTRIAAPPRFDEGPASEDGRYDDEQRYDEQHYDEGDYAEQPYEQQHYEREYEQDYEQPRRGQERYEGHPAEQDYERRGQERYPESHPADEQDYEDDAYHEGHDQHYDRQYEDQQYDESYEDHDGYDEREHDRAAEHPADAATTFTPAAALDDDPPTTITPAATVPPAQSAQQAPPPPPAPPAQPRPGAPEPERERRAPEPIAQQRADEQPPTGPAYDEGPPTEYSPGPLVYDEPVLEDLHERLGELGVPATAYRIGEPADRGWALEEAAEGWRVGWYDDKQLTSPAVFGDVEDAAAFMLGKLLLAPEGVAQEARPRPETAAPAPQPAPQPERQGPQRITATLPPDVATGARPPAPAEPHGEPRMPAPPREEPRRQPAPPAPPAQGGPTPPAPPASAPASREPSSSGSSNGQGGKGQQWPIQPLPGEPPLTLFRGKEMRELPVGSELDRFGGPNGNLTYAAGTPFEERSLVPEWVNRPYHVYRVQRPIRALAGVAIPWFNQPGGGAAYLLPASVEDLLADGDLIELEPSDPPVD
ncbi:glycohydrolase toxin TNT-related protein [Saccharomonospora sp. NB11]|uniref:glycohydrolase toxin TNT-related protein n=1 Tax=Saccharomonospora sp. NB11 TaxID=1642298 RepID=UPI0018D18546|nr:glycohydrolase toxin TNT-related protein [Saccharomonospora sp. NB11]